MIKKLNWKKPILNRINLGKRCNPVKPQIDQCEATGVPQQGTTCTGNKVGLS